MIPVAGGVLASAYEAFDSSVGRAWDCNLQPYLSGLSQGRWFDPGSKDMFFFSQFPRISQLKVARFAGCVRVRCEAFDSSVGRAWDCN